MGHRCRSLAWWVAVSLGFSACATTTEFRTQQIRVFTQPDNARVWQKDEKGQRNLGQSPLTVEQQYPVQVTRPSRWWWLAIGVSGAVTGVGAALYDSSPDVAPYITYGGAGLLALSVGAFYYLNMLLGEEAPPEPRLVTLGASLDGYLDQEIQIPVPGPDQPTSIVLQADPERLGLVRQRSFEPIETSDNVPPTLVQPPQELPDPGGYATDRRAQTTIVAVFDVQDFSKKFNKETLEQLTEYLAARLTQVTPFKVVPRDQLRNRLSTMKRGTYRQCFEQSCQIELGKALAAQKTLATKIIKVGKSCAVTSVLFDLRTETADKSATARTPCSPDSLMDSMDRVARQFSGDDLR